MAFVPSAKPAGGRQVESGQDVRASDHERELVVERLTRAVGQGRLSLEEFESRVAAAHASVTRADLAQLTRDLPGRLW
jgi:type IV secretory pathway VirD2 relaxase